MYSVIYLSRDRRVIVYEEGGFQQERLEDYLEGLYDVSKVWLLANDEDWPDLPDVLLKFSTLFFNAHNNAKIV